MHHSAGRSAVDHNFPQQIGIAPAAAHQQPTVTHLVDVWPQLSLILSPIGITQHAVLNPRVQA
jgi:hypothetical protein